MEKIATADFEYTEEIHQKVTLVRRQRSLRVVGLIIAAACLTLLIIFILGIATGVELTVATGVLTAVFAIGSVIGLWLGITGAGSLAGANEKALAAFFGGHGIKEKHHDRWAMRERVEVEAGGISVAWGEPGCKNKDLTRVFTPWSEWKYLVQTEDLVIVICKTPEDGLLRGAFGENPTLDGQHADAAIPKKKLQGMKSEALVTFLEDEIGD